MVIITARALLVVVRASPAREANGLVGEFVKGLLHELGTGQPVMDPQALATPLRDGRDARASLEFGGRLPACAVTWLERACDERVPSMVFLNGNAGLQVWDPNFDPYRADPRFQALLRRRNLPEDESPPVR